VHQNYFRDFINLRLLRVEDDGLEFSNPVKATAGKKMEAVVSSTWR
jgi:hypothetical protein